MSTPRPAGYRPASGSRPSAYRPAAGPPRTGLAIASLVLGLLSFFTCGLAGIGALTGLVLGIVALAKESRQPRTYGGRGMAIAGVILNAIGVLALPMAAAIAIPSLLRARVAANEAAAIADVQTLISAQVAYGSANGGYFDSRLECLVTPAGCIPGHAAGGPSFLDPTLASARPRHGYRGQLTSGPAVQLPPERAGQVSPSSVQAFAYVVEPVKFGQTGVRAFCGDASGIVCFTLDGSTPRTTPAGLCDQSSCRLLR
jgi:type II secretory pathway pseudopilin PulG